ncbi:MAG: type II secretion system F family protein (plasmid) [Candidatus Symbiodolus clandestinus]
MYSDGFKKWLYRKTFSNKDRVDFYIKLNYLLEQEQLKDALNDLIDIFSDNGEKPFHPMVVVLTDCLQSISSGHSLSQSLSKWVPKDEVSTIASGEVAGSLKLAFNRVIKLVEAKMKIQEALLGGMVYPITMLLSCSIMLNIISKKLIPIMSKIIPINLWTSKLMVLYYISYVVTHYGIWLVITFFILLFFTIYSLPRWTGDSRVNFDRFGPWAIYKACQGALFLMNLASLLSSGVQLKDSLNNLSENSSPWLLQRIRATVYGIEMGAENLGIALKSSGYDFPDRESINFLCIISRGRGGENRIIEFSEKWLDNSIKKIISISNLIRNLGIFLTIGLLILVILCSADLSSLLSLKS